ncbi:MAG: aminotransferase class I/II-fold pyridoxal phosphate-dependent enzyme [Chloroflexi bacterium]|nr:MAG: aminotransferase class I/II-fold pyridoxal phosphate-dependent enzyme [Chloroflexota bacterium]
MRAPDRRSMISATVARLPASGIRRFFDLVGSMEGGISLGIGEPDFVTPQHIRDAAIASIRAGQTKYTSNYGIYPLREAIGRHLEARYGLRYDPSDEILVTVGVSEAVDLALRATLNGGDEVILADPSYVAYVPGIVLAGAVPIPVPTRDTDAHRLLPSAVAKRVTPRTRALFLGFPNNPSGAVLEPADIEGLAKIAREHDLIVYSDEIYDRLVYGTAHHSIAALPGMKERTVYLGGFSKSYAMTGWRVGYACAPAEVIEQMMKIHQYTVMCVPTAAQYAAVEALANGEPDVREMVAEYDRRRRFMWKRFNDMGLACFEPRGAFYCFPNIQSTGLGSEEFATRLLEEEKVVVVPGNAFGEHGEGHVRACYATSMREIEQACDRIERFVRRARA